MKMFLNVVTLLFQKEALRIPIGNNRDKKSEEFQDGAWLNVKKQIL